jgi:hypothetical protein
MKKLIIALASCMCFTTAWADDTVPPNIEQERLNRLEARVNTLEVTNSQLSQELTTLEAKDKKANTGLTFGNKTHVKLTIGGFIEATAIHRSANETTDVGSNWNTIPFKNSPNASIPETRFSSRQSRLSLLAESDVSQSTALAAYFEGDFLGAALTANSAESNSYTPRIRQLYGTVDWKDSGWHLLAGQTWSLITLNKVGITPRTESPPMVIDAQYVPGFTWTRNPQVRIVKDLADKKVWLGLSLESPQALIANTPAAPAPANTVFNNSGASQLTSTATYSTDKMPDVVVKAAFDPGWGHYEVFGLMRSFDSYAPDGNTEGNKGTRGEGFGASAILPVLPENMLSVQLSFLTGKGVGRYGSVQLPDVIVGKDGSLSTIHTTMALLGLISKPNELWDIYSYIGMEKASANYYNVGGKNFGYGNPAYNNTGCNTLGSTICAGNTESVTQGTVGFWYRIYKGNAGIVQVGLSDSITRRNAFAGVGGAPTANENVMMASIRFYPF